MDWSRLGSAVPDALVISFALGALLTPPDPFTQLLYAVPAFLVALSTLWLYGDPSVTPWWRRYLLFVGVIVVVGLAWQATAFAVGLESASGVRSAFTLAGVVFAAWMAYFGGLERLRDREAVSES
ncbi:twin-arginine translocase subunit TatC [Halorussus limi]|uniref:Twin-arginine translocase subunit TatC n=1 Tax=Halorussus limi TaxID=2938695 RepID=A0A8U0HPW0_9EURY|nr:twin-arginine translocase subunit TatC [Halorussus limi]UPV72776.1 twin-arginine translocase subunit TatC [Halorussus limi]